jgi:hypothetical protein
MDANDLQSLRCFVTLNSGKEIYHYDQADDVRIKGHQSTKEGWCAGMASWWIGYKKAGMTNFWSWMKSEEAAAIFRTEMELRETLANSVTSQKNEYVKAFEGLMKVHLISTCLTQWDVQIHNVEKNWKGVGQAIKALNFKYFLVNAKGDGTGGHTVAAYRPNLNDVYYFDPNFGEYSFPVDKLATFLAVLSAKKLLFAMRPPISTLKGNSGMSFYVTYGETQ